MKTPSELDSPEKRKAFAALYTRVIVWSEVDECFIGSLPEIDGWCTHADTVEACAKNLDECAEIAVDDYVDGGISLNPPGSCAVIPPSSFNNSKNAGGDIAKLRHSFGLSQESFAAALGISKSTLSKWEAGYRKPDKASAKLLSIIEKHPETLYA
jgi:predicted RNase H-like HicB family nuclease/DNA-binding XRE family transcriptional regulator